MKKIVIVGAGITGCTLANLLSDNNEVILIEKNNHIGGNCYDYTGDAGIVIHKYGPHIFHTNYDDVWRYLNKFTKFNGYVHKVKAVYNGELFDWPITLDTINKFYGQNLDEGQAKLLINLDLANRSDEDNFENIVISRVGNQLYEAFIKSYTTKQWGRDPKILSSNFAPRIEIRYDNDKRFFKDKHQGIPITGYTQMMQNMIDKENIKIVLGVTLEDDIDNDCADLTIITSPIDEFYNYSLGNLEYLSQDFYLQNKFEDDFEENIGAYNYAESKFDFIRITCMNRFGDYAKNKPYVYLKEHPLSKTPLIVSYPVQDKKNIELYNRYKELKTKDHLFAGRLATFQYINMDAAVKRAMDMAKEIKEKLC